MTVKYPDVTAKLIGEDGNAFGIIGTVNRALKRAHGIDAADAFTAEAMNCTSYDALLCLVQNTVNVE
jgi:hypothetical protein